VTIAVTSPVPAETANVANVSFNILADPLPQNGKPDYYPSTLNKDAELHIQGTRSIQPNTNAENAPTDIAEDCYPATGGPLPSGGQVTRRDGTGEPIVRPEPGNPSPGDRRDPRAATSSPYLLIGAWKALNVIR
jgi:hypothetical protein